MDGRRAVSPSRSRFQHEIVSGSSNGNALDLDGTLRLDQPLLTSTKDKKYEEPENYRDTEKDVCKIGLYAPIFSLLLPDAYCPISLANGFQGYLVKSQLNFSVAVDKWLVPCITLGKDQDLLTPSSFAHKGGLNVGNKSLSAINIVHLGRSLQLLYECFPAENKIDNVKLSEMFKFVTYGVENNVVTWNLGPIKIPMLPEAPKRDSGPKQLLPADHPQLISSSPSGFSNIRNEAAKDDGVRGFGSRMTTRSQTRARKTFNGDGSC